MIQTIDEQHPVGQPRQRIVDRIEDELGFRPLTLEDAPQLHTDDPHEREQRFVRRLCRRRKELGRGDDLVADHDRKAEGGPKTHIGRKGRAGEVGVRLDVRDPAGGPRFEDTTREPDPEAERGRHRRAAEGRELLRIGQVPHVRAAQVLPFDEKHVAHRPARVFAHEVDSDLQRARDGLCGVGGGGDRVEQAEVAAAALGGGDRALTRRLGARPCCLLAFEPLLEISYRLFVLRALLVSGRDFDHYTAVLRTAAIQVF